MGSCASSPSIAAATAEDFDFVHPTPRKLLVDNIAPGTKPRQVYNLNIGEKGTISYYSDRAPFAVQISKDFSQQSDIMVLEEIKTKQVVAVLHREFDTKFAWRIFSFQPCHQGQKPTSTRTYQGRQLYEWALVKRHNNAGFKGYCLHSQDPSSRIYFAEKTIAVGSPLRVRRGTGTCGMISRRVTGDIADGTYRNVKIGAGIDPALFVCYAAIVAEIIQEVEKSKQTRADHLETGAEVMGVALDLVEIFQ